MARRPNPALGAAASEEAEEASTTMEGGAPGIPPANEQLPAQQARAEVRLDQPLQRYRVMESAPLLYGGARTHLAAGKVVDGYAYDLDMLRRQGVRLEPLPLDPEPPKG